MHSISVNMATNSTEVVIGNEGHHNTYKILVIGDSGVGKTALLHRYCDNTFQTSSFVATVGIDHKNKIINLDGETIKLQIWDTAGQERFRTLTNAYFRGASGAVLLYDITCRASYSNIEGWMESIYDHGSHDIKMVIVGHKADLQDERAVTMDEGKKLAENYDSLFFEASAKTGYNCSKIFTRLAQVIKISKESLTFMSHNPMNRQPPLTDSDKLEMSVKPQPGCC